MEIKIQKDLIAGVLFSVIGMAFFVGAGQHELGSASEMGPGYFPRLLAGILIVLGLLISIKSVVAGIKSGNSPEGYLGRIAWRPLFFIVAANVLFGISIGGLPSVGVPKLGLVLGVVLLTFCASFAHTEFKFKTTALVALLLTVGSYLLFIVFLKQNIPLWPELA